MDGNPGSCLAVQLAVVSVTMECDGGLVAVNDFGQARTSQVRPDFSGFAFHCVHNRSIVSHDHSFLRSQHGESALQLHGLIYRGLHKSLYFFFTKCRKHAPAKTAEKALGSGKANAVSFVAAAVQNFDSFSSHQADELLLLSALIIMVPEHRHNGNAQAHQGVQQ